MSRVYSENNNSDMMAGGVARDASAVWSDWQATHESSNILSQADNEVEDSFNSTRSLHNLRGTRGYATNDHFPDSQFISEDDMDINNDFSSIVYNNNDKDNSQSSSLRSPVGTSSSIGGSIRKYSDDPFDTVQQRHKSSNRTTVEDPEFLHYLKNDKRQEQHQLKPNDLIVKNIGELSGEVYNTFKNKKTRPNKRNSTTTTNTTTNTTMGNSNSEDDSMNDTSNEVFRDAKNVYEGMITQTNKNLTNIKKQNKLPLITPESVGFNFQNNLGKWVMNKDETNSQDISANHTVADISSSTTSQPLINSTSSPPRKNNNTKKNIILEDTPLPFKIKKILPDELPKAESSLETFESHKISLIHKLTPILINRNWDKLVNLNARNLNLINVTGLNICFPELISCDLSNNNIKVFDLMNSIPSKLIELNLSNNLINETFLHNDDNEMIIFNNIKLLNLSNNKFSKNLSWLTMNDDKNNNRFINLKELNLTGNQIKSLIGLPNYSTIEKLNLSNNEINGIIDFKELIKGDNKFGWSYIKELNLSGNGITKIYNLHLLKSLTHLNLNNNPLTSIYYPKEVEINDLIHLEILSNKLKNLGGDDEDRQYLSMPNLQILKIPCYENLFKIKELPQGLIKLSIQGGQFKNLIEWGVIPGSVQTLEIVKIAGLTRLPDNKYMEIWFASLQELNLSGNDLSSWTNLIQFLPFTHLKTLRLEDNNMLLFERGVKDRERLEPELRTLLMTAIPSLDSVTL